MQKIRRIFIYLFSFSIARGLLFISPIFLANLLSKDTYGIFEWAQAAATLSSTVATLGMAAVVPLVILKKIPNGSLAGIFFHHIVIAFICLLLLCTSLVFFVNKSFILLFLLIPALSLQVLWSTYLKTQGKNEFSMFLDAALFSLIAITAFFSKYLIPFHSLDCILIIITIYVVTILLITILEFVREKKRVLTLSYKYCIVLGYPLMIATLVTVAVTTSGRLAIGYLGGVLMTADYAILARVAALPIVAHQIMVVAKFRHIFTLSDVEVEIIIIKIVAMVVFCVVGLWIFAPYVGYFIGGVFVEAFNGNKLPAVWILAQSILWSAIALHDSINTRCQTMNKVLPWSTLSLILLTPCAFLLIQSVGLSLAHFVYIHGLVMLMFYLIQAFVMYRAGIRLLKVWFFSVFSYLTIVTIACLLYERWEVL